MQNSKLQPISFLWKRTEQNPEWKLSNLTKIYRNTDHRSADSGDLLRSCLINNNAEKIQTVKDYYLIKRIPKWYTTFKVENSNDDGEMVETIYQSDDLKNAKNRKIKAVQKFGAFYQPLFQKKKISLMFHTFTRVQFAKTDIRRIIDNVKYHYTEMLGLDWRAYIWVLEISKNNHIHYHLMIAVNRFKVDEMPEEIKFNGLWGQRTQVSFVKYSIVGYMGKYIQKDEARIIGMRSYGMTRNFI